MSGILNDSNNKLYKVIVDSTIPNIIALTGIFYNTSPMDFDKYHNANAMTIEESNDL